MFVSFWFVFLAWLIFRAITVWCVESGSGLWGYACKSSTIDKENCALICLSSTCYDSVYGNDPVSYSSLSLSLLFHVTIFTLGHQDLQAR